MPILQNDIDPTWQDGINLTDTFDVWRKKTNGHIAGYKSIITNDDIADLTIQSIKLAPPAPSWDTQGTVTTNGAVGAFIVKGGFTSGSASSINVAGAASSSSALQITSSTRVLRFNPNSTIGEKNPLVAVGDYSIIAGSSNFDTQNIIIGKWSNSSHGVVIGQGKVGINRVATTDAFEVQGAISATSSITGTSLSAGSGTISTTGAITGGSITGTSLSAGTGTISTTGAITGGTITCTSLTATVGITGNLTGNATSATTAASCTGNSATATSATTAASCTGNSATATTAASCIGNSATATVAAFANDYAGKFFKPHGILYVAGESGYTGNNGRIYRTGTNAYVDLELHNLAENGFLINGPTYAITVEVKGFNGDLLAQAFLYPLASQNSILRTTLLSNLDTGYANNELFYNGVHVQIRDHHTGKISMIIGASFNNSAAAQTETGVSF